MRHIVYGLLLILACTGVVFSFGMTMSICMWGCPQTAFSYFIQSSFYILIVLVLFIAYRWYKGCNSKTPKIGTK